MPLHNCPNCGCNLVRFQAFRYGNVEIDARGDVVFEGRTVDIAPTQRAIVEALIHAQGRLLPRGTLANIIPGDASDASVNQYIMRARHAFQAIEPTFAQIECSTGYGAYRWAYREASVVRMAG
jgi:DNA-binding response OmpR family regulator